MSGLQHMRDTETAFGRLHRRLAKLDPKRARQLLVDALMDFGIMIRDTGVTFDQLMAEFNYIRGQVSNWVHSAENLIEGCRDQPAGTPIHLEEGQLGIVLARHYNEKTSPRSRNNPRYKRKKKSPEEDAKKKVEDKALRQKLIVQNSIRREAQRQMYLSMKASGASDEDLACFGWYYGFGKRGSGGYWKQRNYFFSERLNAYVYIQQHSDTGKLRHSIHPIKQDDNFKFDMYLNTSKAATVHLMQAETKAMMKLREHVTEAQFLSYYNAGHFVEKSKRSQLTYIFRRMRPTLVYREGKNKVKQFIAGLCLHAQGYYGVSWAGTLPPTDDVITHLMFMRADEKDYWRKATQHSKSIQADF